MLMPQLASDNFTRANENPISDGGNWSQWLSSAGFCAAQIVSNKAESTSTGASNNGDTIRTGFSPWPNDQWSEVTVSACAGTNNFVGCSVRMATGVQTGYRCFWTNATGLGASGTLTIQRMVAGVAATLTTVAVTISAGSTIRLLVVGSRLVALVNGAPWLGVIDTNITSGTPGFIVTPVTSVANAALSAWSGGAVVQQTRVTGFSDNFTRANENPLGNGNWSTYVEAVSNPFKIVSNVAEASVINARNGSYVSSLTLPTDHWAEMTMAANMNGLAAMGPQARGILGASYAYWRFVYSVGWIFQTQSTPGTNSLTNQGTVLSSSAPVTGDKIRIECSGNIIAGFLNNVFFAACISSAASTGIVTGMNGNPNSTLTFAQFSLFTTGTFSSLPNALMLTGCGT